MQHLADPDLSNLKKNFLQDLAYKITTDFETISVEIMPE